MLDLWGDIYFITSPLCTVDEYRNWYTDTLGILSNLFKSIGFVKWTLDSSVSDGSVIKFKWVSSSIFQSDIEEGSSVRRTTIAAASATVTRSLSRKTCTNPQVKINRDKIRAWKKPYNLLELYSPVPTSKLTWPHAFVCRKNRIVTKRFDPFFGSRYNARLSKHLYVFGCTCVV